MRHVFIINPAAGKDKRSLKLIPEIDSYFKQHSGDYEIYVTKEPMDAKNYVQRQVQSEGAFRFYACGGDGTLMEVLNGAYGYPSAEIAFFPCGSANDYIKSYGSAEAFLSVEAQVKGTAYAVDAMDCNGRISLNICDMGMDADVADKMVYFKHFPLVTGNMAYRLAIVYMFFHPIGRHLRAVIETENGTVELEGNYLFTLVGNGQYYGSGYRGAPHARLNDGKLDFIFVDTISRAAIPGFLKRYKAGRHLDMSIVHTFQGQRMRIQSASPVTVCVDGECFSEKEVTIALCPHKVRFVLPQGIPFPGE